MNRMNYKSLLVILLGGICSCGDRYVGEGRMLRYQIVDGNGESSRLNSNSPSSIDLNIGVSDKMNENQNNVPSGVSQSNDPAVQAMVDMLTAQEKNTFTPTVDSNSQKSNQLVNSNEPRLVPLRIHNNDVNNNNYMIVEDGVQNNVDSVENQYSKLLLEALQNNVAPVAANGYNQNNYLKEIDNIARIINIGNNDYEVQARSLNEKQDVGLNELFSFSTGYLDNPESLFLPPNTADVNNVFNTEAMGTNSVVLLLDGDMFNQLFDASAKPTQEYGAPGFASFQV